LTCHAFLSGRHSSGICAMTARLDCTEPYAAAGKSKAPQIIIAACQASVG
jgi:hypothetical protein